jgi:hypothetical protein
MKIERMSDYLEQRKRRASKEKKESAKIHRIDYHNITSAPIPVRCRRRRSAGCSFGRPLAFRFISLEQQIAICKTARRQSAFFSLPATLRALLWEPPPLLHYLDGWSVGQRDNSDGRRLHSDPRDYIGCEHSIVCSCEATTFCKKLL